jgi:hypothetical protein
MTRSIGERYVVIRMAVFIRSIHDRAWSHMPMAGFSERHSDDVRLLMEKLIARALEE